MLKGLSRDDARMYYGDCYFRVGDKVMALTDVRSDRGQYTCIGHDIMNGNVMEIATKDVDFSFPALGYINVEERGAAYISRSQGRNYKKGFRARECLQAWAMQGIGRGPQPARLDKHAIYEVMFPKYCELGKARARCSNRFKKYGDGAYTGVTLSANFCVVRNNDKLGKFYLLYRTQVVGEVNKGRGEVSLYEHALFLKKRMIKEVPNVKFV